MVSVHLEAFLKYKYFLRQIIEKLTCQNIFWSLGFKLPPPSTLPSKSVLLVFLIRYESLTANLYLLISKCKSCMSFNRTVPIWKNIKRRWSSPGLRLGRHSNSIHRMHLYTRRNLINPNLVSFIFLKYFNNLKISKPRICWGYSYKKGKFFSIFKVSIIFFLSTEFVYRVVCEEFYISLLWVAYRVIFIEENLFFYFYLS